MLETILGLTVLNTILILYMYRVIKDHHFYDGYPKNDWFLFDFTEVKIQKIMNIIEVKDLKKAYLLPGEK